MHPFIQRYEALTGDSADDIIHPQLMKTLRVNTLKISEDDLVNRLREKDVQLTKVPFLPHAYTFQADFSLGATEEYLLGYYYLQEAASQLPVVALLEHFTPDEQSVVLDMAAAPGSKTTQLAAAMQNKGKIIAIDESMNRCKVLADNLERCGVTNTYAYVKDAQYAKDLKQHFDAILLDAPCSGNFCLTENWFDKRNAMDIAKSAELQKELLTVALSILKPGGILIYSTCSLEPEENEFLLNAGLPASAKILPISLGTGSPAHSEIDGKKLRDDLKNAVRMWPHRHHTQGFFVAAIQKT